MVIKISLISFIQNLCFFLLIWGQNNTWQFFNVLMRLSESPLIQPLRHAHLASGSQCISSSNQNNNFPRHQSLEVFPRDHRGQRVLFLLIVIVTCTENRHKSTYKTQPAGCATQNIHPCSRVLDTNELVVQLDPGGPYYSSSLLSECSRLH